MFCGTIFVFFLNVSQKPVPPRNDFHYETTRFSCLAKQIMPEKIIVISPAPSTTLSAPLHPKFYCICDM